MSPSLPIAAPRRLLGLHRAWARLGLAIAIGLACTGTAAPVAAEWRNAQQVTLGTAQVLEQGERTFGVVAPLAYGLTSQWTVQSHPILDLLLVPNVASRYRLIERGGYVVSATGSYKQAFSRPALQGSDGAAAEGEEAGSPGDLNLGGIGTWYPNDRWALTLAPVYALRMGLEIEEACRATAAEIGECPTYSHGAGVAVEAHHLLGKRDLLLASAFVRYDVSRGGFDPFSATVAWVHEWSRFHLVLGLSAGRFPISDLFGTWSIFPLVDLWFRD